MCVLRDEGGGDGTSCQQPARASTDGRTIAQGALVGCHHAGTNSVEGAGPRTRGTVGDIKTENLRAKNKGD